MPAPTFLCIGAQKCGTTWLARAVRQHPEVGPGRRKELHFFNHRDAYERGLDWYESQFRPGPRTRATGEFTPNYWWTKGTATSFHYLGCADRIADAYPGIQLIVCLRDPVERAISAYFHHMKAGRYAPSVSLLDATVKYPDIRGVRPLRHAVRRLARALPRRPIPDLGLRGGHRPGRGEATDPGPGVRAHRRAARIRTA
jgi:hypothetical protein